MNWLEYLERPNKPLQLRHTGFVLRPISVGNFVGAAETDKIGRQHTVRLRQRKYDAVPGNGTRPSPRTIVQQEHRWILRITCFQVSSLEASGVYPFFVHSNRHSSLSYVWQNF